jgi:hypothetical protein
MSLDVWYSQDIWRILASLASAGILQGPEYHKALRDVALAFGLVELPAPTIINVARCDDEDIEAHLLLFGGSHRTGPGLGGLASG